MISHFTRAGSMLEAFELALRGGAATTFLLLSLLMLRDGGNRTLARLGALFAVSTAWWALNTHPFAGWSFSWAAPLVVVSFGKTAAFWLFTRALFDDDFRLRPLDWAIWGTMVAVGGVWLFRAQAGLATDVVRIPHQLAQIGLAIAAGRIAWKARIADLMEPRRRARIAFVLLSSLFMIGITFSYLLAGKPTPIVTDLNVARMFVMAIGMTMLVSGLRSEELFGRAPAPPSCGGRNVVISDDPAEARLLAKLQRLMEEERVYRLEGLTIGSLAMRVGVPEYAMRRLINGRLRYRNFNAFLNEWRLSDAKAALRDHSQRNVEISTIALDSGFNSLGPFNRAFRASEGMTPSEFREARCPERAAEPPVQKFG